MFKPKFRVLDEVWSPWMSREQFSQVMLENIHVVETREIMTIDEFKARYDLDKSYD